MVGPREAAVLCGPRCFNAFFEEVEDGEDLKQVRDGEGSWKQVTRYHHVGAGQGDFNLEAQSPQYQPWLLVTLGGLGALLAFMILAVAHQKSYSRCLYIYIYI